MPEGDMSSGPPVAGAILRKTAQGAGWVVGWRLARRLLGLASTVVLARLLLPNDFGLVALATGVAGALESLSSLGIEDAIVRTRAPSRELFDTGFTLNLIRGIGTATVVAIAAWPVARFFGDARLWAVMLTLAAATAIGSMTNIGTTDFRRAIAFDKEFVLLVVPKLIGTIATLAAALLTRSYWSLVIGIVSTRFLGVAISYRMHPYRPRLSLACWTELAGFSFWVWAIGMAQMVRDRLDQFMIGKLLGDQEVGILNVSWEIAHLPTTELVGPLGRACFSGFSAIRHTGEDAGKLYLRVLALVCLVVFPAGVGISAVAAPLVRLLLGPNWSAAAPIASFAAAVSIAAGFGLITTNLLTAFGTMKAQFQITLLFTAIRVVLLVLLIPPYGLLGAIAAAGIGMVAEFGTYVVLAARQFRVGLAAHGAIMWRPAIGVAVMAGVLAYAHLGWLPAGGSIRGAADSLAVAGTVGASVYCGAVALLWRVGGRSGASAEADLIELLASSLGRISRRMGHGF